MDFDFEFWKKVDFGFRPDFGISDFDLIMDFDFDLK
jgi:hypothetical protein